MPSQPSIADELKSLWRLALPLALAQAGQALMGMVDTAVVGRLSSTAQAAAGLGNSLTFTIMFFGMGVMMALDPLVSQAIGAKKPVEARTHYWTGVWLALATSVVLLVPLLVMPVLLKLVGVEAEVAAGAIEYIDYRLPGVAGQLLFVGARSYLQGLGRTRAIVIAMVGANVLNLGLDVALVFGAGPIPAMGIAGASIATTACTWFQFALLVPALGPSLPGVRRALDVKALVGAARLGLPVGAHLLAEGGVFGLAGLLAARLGAASSAAHQVALTWASLTFCVAVGIGSAGSVRVGWGVGARDLPAARRSGLVAFGSGALFMSATALMFIVMPEPLARLLSPNDGVVAVASSLFVVTAVFQVSDGVQGVGAGVLRGYADTRFTFIANVIGHWFIGLPLSWWLGVRGDLGVVGLWWGLSAGLSVVGVAVFIRFERLSRSDVRAVESPSEDAQPDEAMQRPGP
ncbi:MAG: MATE family efflux transporter [Archangiaceae bacterium]|nr:MATE family efflux transporter [Archangiaceae bacterium]